ncbi:MAG: tRNA uridine-5-carboxymethylaminomethyl(34) synthesis GTPase MnmE, partial [Candidatus Omnitrophota bacterium]|nr:tRNA uridine-5-carboxymethylaminomethyl(34) synthesis GTPase MnmE [Candidatus Omnitrophota bacterium]
GIVRLSGPDALNVADKIFSAKDKRRPSQYKTYTLHYGWIVDPSSVNDTTKDPSTSLGVNERRTTKDGIIDEVLLTIMRAPRSYTREDVVEINCHGGLVAMRRVLDLALENGCRLSRPGEFTMRAFLNGRIDLAQAEAVADIICAKTDSALNIAAAQLEGGLSRRINKIRNGLLDALVLLEANIDFPEEDTALPQAGALQESLGQINKELISLLDSAGRGRILREGIQAVICGLPNVGKSSLLNALLKQERSIVTPVAGTTRDTIEEVIDIRGIPVKIVDTAGLIEPRDLVEKKAVARAKKYIDTADLVILVFDSSKRLSRQDKMLMQRLRKKKVLVVMNKIDLRPRIEKDQILKKFPGAIGISAKKLKQIGLLEDAIVSLVCSGKVCVPSAAVTGNIRHIQALDAAQKLVAEAIASLDNRLSAEFVAQDLRDALKPLDGIVGAVFSQDLLDKIFSSFCIGK